MVAAVHVLEPGRRAGDAEILRHRVRAWTMAAESVLHDLGVIHMLSSDSQGMGRIGEVVQARVPVRRRDEVAARAGARAGRTTSASCATSPRSRSTRRSRTASPGTSARSRSASWPTLVLWAPELFAVRPELVLKAGIPAWGASGEGNGTTCSGSLSSSSASSAPSARRPRGHRWRSSRARRWTPTSRPLARAQPWTGCRELSAADMLRNTRTGTRHGRRRAPRGHARRRAGSRAAGGAPRVLGVVPDRLTPAWRAGLRSQDSRRPTSQELSTC